MNDRPTTGITLTRLPQLTIAGDYHNAGVVAPDGTLYVICTEGVGWEVTAAAPFRGKDRDYTRDELVTAVREARETVQLEDWVRTFGARLESNFHQWHRTLTGS